MPQSPKNTRFIASGKQGCVFEGDFRTATTSQCTEPPAQPSTQLVTKVMKDKVAYENEKAAAAILQQHRNEARNFAVYAVRACHVELETLDGELLKECNDKNTGKGNLTIDFTGTGYIMEMPHVPHITLKDFATSHKIDHATGKRYFHDLENAIKTLHDWGICHSDLHNENVWIVNDHIMIADFGSTKISNMVEDKMNDIRYAKTSFAAIWSAVDKDERGGIKPEDIERHIDKNGTFFNWLAPANEGQRPRFTDAETPPSASRRQRSSRGAQESIARKLF